MGAALPIISVGASIIGTVVSAQAQRAQAMSEAAASNYRAQVAQNNAIISRRKAEDARRRGAIEEREQRIRTAQLIGLQRAGAAGRGVEVDTGSAADIVADTAALGELDALTIRHNAEIEALGLESQASQFDAEAGLRTSTARGQRAGAEAAAFGTLLTGSGRVAEKWYNFSN